MVDVGRREGGASSSSNVVADQPALYGGRRHRRVACLLVRWLVVHRCSAYHRKARLLLLPV